MERPAVGRALQHLRSKRGRKRDEVAGALGGLTDKLLGRYERGEKTPSRERSEEILAVLDYPPEALDVMLLADDLVGPEERPEPPSPLALSAGERREIDRTRMATACAVAAALDALLTRWAKLEKAAQARREAAEQMERLKPLPPAGRRELVATFPEYRTWAMKQRQASRG